MATAFLPSTAPLSLGCTGPPVRTVISGRNKSFYRRCRSSSLVLAGASGPSTSIADQPLGQAQVEDDIWTNQWYPVIWEQDYNPSKPYAFSIFDRPLVLFKDGTDFTVLLDICPHRAVPLSEGRLYDRTDRTGQTNTVLECGYHGWTFDATGTCIRIPQMQEDMPISNAANCKKRFATAIKLGIVFVWLGEYHPADESRIPIPQFYKDNQDAKIFRNSTRILPYPFELFQENICDPAHVPWVHHGTGQGDRNTATSDSAMTLTSRAKDGGFKVEVYSRSKPGRRISEITFHPPCLVTYNFGRFCLTTLAVPSSQESVRVLSFNGLLVPSTWSPLQLGLMSPRWLEHTKANLILDGDLKMLRQSGKYLTRAGETDQTGVESWKGRYYLPCDMDQAVGAFRRWYDTSGASVPWFLGPVANPDPITVDRSRPVLLDRFEQHTKDCSSCRVALQRFRFGSSLASLGGVCSLTAAISGNSPKLLVPTLICALIVFGSQRGIEELTYTEKAYEVAHRNE